VAPEEASEAVTSEAADAPETVGLDRVPAPDVTAERDDVDADEAFVRDPDDATAGSALSRAPAPDRPASLSSTARVRGGALATVVLPRVRRFGPPVLGALVVGSVISGIVRRLRR
jgi:hypothetical protein